MTVIESAWPKHPDYRIELAPVAETARVWFGDLLLAETNDALLLQETRHIDRLYIPHRDVKWEHFTFSEGIHTICPFKGEADYWDLTAVDPVETNIVWEYPDAVRRGGWNYGTTCASTRSAPGSRSTNVGQTTRPATCAVAGFRRGGTPPTSSD